MLTSAVNTTLQKHNPPNWIFSCQFMISNCVYDSMKMKHAHIHTQCQLNFKHLSHDTKFSEQQDKTMNHRSPNELSLGCQQRELRGEIRLPALCSYFTEVMLLPCSQIQKVVIYVCSADQAGIFTYQQKFFFSFLFFQLLEILVPKTNSTKVSAFILVHCAILQWHAYNISICLAGDQGFMDFIK